MHAWGEAYASPDTLLRYLSVHTQFRLTKYAMIEYSSMFKMLKMNNITPTRSLFTFSDSSWDDSLDSSNSTGGYIIFTKGVQLITPAT